MNQEYCDFGYLPNDNAHYTYTSYTSGTDHDGSNINAAPNTWDAPSHDSTTVLTEDNQFAMTHYYQWPSNMPPSWYQQDITSPSDMTSEPSSIPYGNMMVHSESESAGMSEPWEQDIQVNQMPSTTCSPGLFSNIGSNFASDPAAMQSLLIPPSMAMESDPVIPELEPVISAHFSEKHGLSVTNNTLFNLESSSLQAKPTPAQPHLQQRRLKPSIHNRHLTSNRKQSHLGRPKSASVTSNTSDPSTNNNSSSSPLTKPTSSSINSTTTTNLANNNNNNDKRRLYCPSCINSKDYHRGFRGDHELARHYEQKHSPHRYAWICVDLSPSQSLRNCERCKGKHQYGTSYGGAEHFRRRHSGLFGGDWVERLRGKNGRRALSGGRLVEEGWLRRVRVGGDGGVFGEDCERQGDRGWSHCGVGVGGVF